RGSRSPVPPSPDCRSKGGSTWCRRSWTRAVTPCRSASAWPTPTAGCGPTPSPACASSRSRPSGRPRSRRPPPPPPAPSTTRTCRARRAASRGVRSSPARRATGACPSCPVSRPARRSWSTAGSCSTTRSTWGPEPRRMLDALLRHSLANRMAPFVLAAVLAAGGFYAFTQLTVEAFPDPTDTQVQVITLYAGQPTEEVERRVSIPLERALNGVPGLFRLRSISLFGLSFVTLTFDDGVDPLLARQQVLERLT